MVNLNVTIFFFKYINIRANGCKCLKNIVNVTICKNIWKCLLFFKNRYNTNHYKQDDKKEVR